MTVTPGAHWDVGPKTRAPLQKEGGEKTWILRGWHQYSLCSVGVVSKNLFVSPGVNHVVFQPELFTCCCSPRHFDLPLIVGNSVTLVCFSCELRGLPSVFGCASVCVSCGSRGPSFSVWVLERLSLETHGVLLLCCASGGRVESRHKVWVLFPWVSRPGATALTQWFNVFDIVRPVSRR